MTDDGNKLEEKHGEAGGNGDVEGGIEVEVDVEVVIGIELLGVTSVKHESLRIPCSSPIVGANELNPGFAQLLAS